MHGWFPESGERPLPREPRAEGPGRTNQAILPALEEALRGLDVGDNRKITLDPKQAYGEINPHAFKKVEVNLIPEDLRFEGALLVLSDEKFGEMLIKVDSIQGEEDEPVKVAR